MMRILVVQATRMGDVIQTTPLIRTLRRRHPQAHIAVMVRRMGVPVLQRNPDINDIIVYDEDEMFMHCRAQDSDRIVKAYQKAEEYIRALRDGRFEVAYNCTHSISSAMLLKLAAIPRVVGAHLSDDWQFVLRGGWTNYFFTSVFHREHNALNLCDITGRFADAAPARALVFEVTAADRARADHVLAEHGVDGDARIVCMQLGASEENKRWAPQRFAALARTIAHERSARMVLLGVGEEAALGAAFEQHAPGVAVHLFGKTSLHEAAAILQRSMLLVTNDTGTMHLAAAVGCPVVLVSVGHVHFRETGPYGAGHVAVERRREALGRSDYVPAAADDATFITAGHVQQAVAIALGEPAAPAAISEDIEIHQSAFAPDGFLEWYPVGRPALDWRDFVRLVYRAMWIAHLTGQATGDTAGRDAALRCYDAPDPRVLSGWRSEMDATFGGLAAIAQRGMHVTTKLLAALAQSRWDLAKTLVETLSVLDEEMRVYGEVHPASKPLVIIARYERDNLEGADARQLAQTTLSIYRDCAARCEGVREHAAQWILGAEV
jgi:ADP-heptose:LPS heptosyltransferase